MKSHATERMTVMTNAITPNRHVSGHIRRHIEKTRARKRTTRWSISLTAPLLTTNRGNVPGNCSLPWCWLRWMMPSQTTRSMATAPSRSPAGRGRATGAKFLSCAGIDPNERVVKGLMEFVSQGRAHLGRAVARRKRASPCRDRGRSGLSRAAGVRPGPLPRSSNARPTGARSGLNRGDGAARRGQRGKLRDPHHPGDHDPGHRLECRQVAAGRRAVPRLRAARAAGARRSSRRTCRNNAAVTADGGEIGRAQALQARACGVAPAGRHEPGAAEAAERDRRAGGRAGPACSARCRRARLPGAQADAAAAVLESFARLGARRDLVLVEGAGSPAEVNLRAGDIANMGFAAGRRRAGGAGRRHRPRRRDRRSSSAPMRCCSTPRSGRCSRGFLDQQVPRRSGAVRRRPCR